MTKRTNTGINTTLQTNTKKQHQIDKIFQYRAKKKKGGGGEEKYKIHQAVVEAAINPSDQLTRDTDDKG